jgi:hypothetical protein
MSYNDIDNMMCSDIEDRALSFLSFDRYDDVEYDVTFETIDEDDYDENEDYEQEADQDDDYETESEIDECDREIDECDRETLRLADQTQPTEDEMNSELKIYLKQLAKQIANQRASDLNSAAEWFETHPDTQITPTMTDDEIIAQYHMELKAEADARHAEIVKARKETEEAEELKRREEAKAKLELLKENRKRASAERALERIPRFNAQGAKQCKPTPKPVAKPVAKPRVAPTEVKHLTMPSNTITIVIPIQPEFEPVKPNRKPKQTKPTPTQTKPQTKRPRQTTPKQTETKPETPKQTETPKPAYVAPIAPWVGFKSAPRPLTQAPEPKRQRVTAVKPEPVKPEPEHGWQVVSHKPRSTSSASATPSSTSSYRKDLTCTSLCISVRTNVPCPHGSRCRFAHDVRELVKKVCNFGPSCNRIVCCSETSYKNRTGYKPCEFWHGHEDAQSYSARMGLKSRK